MKRKEEFNVKLFANYKEGLYHLLTPWGFRFRAQQWKSLGSNVSTYTVSEQTVHKNIDFNMSQNNTAYKVKGIKKVPRKIKIWSLSVKRCIRWILWLSVSDCWDDEHLGQGKQYLVHDDSSIVYNSKKF